MEHGHSLNPDYGTGQKKLSVYVIGVALCVLLTVVAFWVVKQEHWPASQVYTAIFAAAIAQFFVQVICFLRLNTQTEQGKINVMALLFTAVILLAVIIGSLWIMWNLHYFMMH